jgi:hypothetical protein
MKDDLRSILRKGDPAAGEPGLTPEEVQGLRRAVLSAVPEPRRRGWMVPAMAGAAALMLAAVIALSLWQPVRPPLPLAGEGRGEGPVLEMEEAAAAENPPPQPSPASREREPEPAPEKKKPVRRAPAPAPVVIAQAAQAEPPAAPHSPTQIQFSTPGGTRIIWVLQPATE